MAVAARMVAVLKFMTGRTAKNLPTQALGAAMLNGPHGLTVTGKEFVCIFFSVDGAIRSKEISQF